MSLSAHELALLTAELYDALAQGAIRHVYARDARTLALEVRQPGANRYLLLCLDGPFTRAHLAPRRPEQPPAPPAFVMLLRKHLTGALITDVEHLPGERVLLLHTARRNPDDESPHPRLTLAVELTGRHANAFLLNPDADHAVLGAALSDRSEVRPITPGAPWTPPPPRPLAHAERDRYGIAALPPDGARSARICERYEDEEHRATARAESTALTRRLREHAKALRRRIKHTEADLQRARDADALKRQGELLQSAFGKVARGATSVTVPDWYDPELRPVEIPLDPTVDLKTHVERLFKRYRRLHNAIPAIEDRLLTDLEAEEAVSAAIIHLDALASALNAATAIAPRAEALEALRAESARLEARGVLPAHRVQPPPSRRREEAALPYRAFTSRSGKTILVGKGPRQNDALTLRVARGADLWLHARDWAGAHVVVRLDRRDAVDHETLLDAATLAAFYSQGRADSVIDVTWTFARNVRKPRGYPPGLVTVADAHTIAVRQDPARLQRLQSTASAP